MISKEKIIQSLKCCGNCEYWKEHDKEWETWFDCKHTESGLIRIQESYNKPSFYCRRWEQRRTLIERMEKLQNEQELAIS